MAEEKQIWGVAGVTDSPDTLIDAAEKVRDSRWEKWDCYTPYPVHGLDEAMGLKESYVPYITLGTALMGAAFAKFIQWWMSAYDYPLIVGGKPLFSLPAFVPVTFEVFVLSGGLITFAALMIICKLLRWHSPLHDAGIMEQITSNRFAVVLEVEDETFSEEEAKNLLEEGGITDITVLYDEPEPAAQPAH